MKAFVVYESHWGNTATIARAIAAGIGPEAAAISTAEATPGIIAEADLVVAGAPLMAFGLPSEGVLRNVATSPGKGPAPDLSHPSMRVWLDGLPRGHGRSASFETRLRWSPGSAASAIERGLVRAGFEPVARPQRFVVKGTYGPLRDGEPERAREWGRELARSVA